MGKRRLLRWGLLAFATVTAAALAFVLTNTPRPDRVTRANVYRVKGLTLPEVRELFGVADEEAVSAEGYTFRFWTGRSGWTWVKFNDQTGRAVAADFFESRDPINPIDVFLALPFLGAKHWIFGERTITYPTIFPGKIENRADNPHLKTEEPFSFPASANGSAGDAARNAVQAANAV